MKTIIAIDPGASGGIAVGYPGAANPSSIAIPMPDTPADLVLCIKDDLESANIEGWEFVAYVEDVGGHVGKPQPGSAMFKFGRGCGVIEGALLALGIRTIYVRPQKWQKHFSLGTASACASKTDWKNKLKGEAARRFPHLKVTLKTADALLILDYARAQP